MTLLTFIICFCGKFQPLKLLFIPLQFVFFLNFDNINSNLKLHIKKENTQMAENNKFELFSHEF